MKRERHTMDEIFRWPLLLGGLILVGLASALFGDDGWDALSWAALAIPLAALLATTRTALDILVWGIVAILLQLVTVLIASHVMKRLQLRVDDGNLAAALPIAAAQLAIALLNAAAMVPA